MLEDFWLPRKEGGKGTEISTLPGGDNLGQIEDIIFFQKKLYKALNVPISRLETENQFNIGRASEITRDELNFQKFINRLRKKFSILFIEALRVQLIIKGIITESDWNKINEYLNIEYANDSHFAELKNAEILTERLRLIQDMDPFIGKYVSMEYVRKNILKLTDEQIKEIAQQIKKEKKSGEYDDSDENDMASDDDSDENDMTSDDEDNNQM